MKLFLCLLAADARQGLRSYLPVLGLTAAICSFECFCAYASVVTGTSNGETLGFADFAFALFAGMEPFEYMEGQQFDFPMAWLTLLCTMTCATLYYPVRDLDGMGSRIIAITCNRWVWWLSKCLWTILAGLGVYLVCVGVCAAATGIAGGSFSFGPATDITRMLNVYGIGSTSVNGSILGFVLALPCAVSASLVLQLAVSLLFNPAAGYLTTVSLFLASAYYANPLLLGNYLMAARLDIALTNGMVPATGGLLSLAVTLACIFAGGFIFQHRDIIGRRESFL